MNTKQTPGLRLAIGHSSLTGPRERNEDYCGIATPEGLELENKGVIAAVADGIGGHKGGREAAEYTVRACSPITSRRPTPGSRSKPSASSAAALNRPHTFTNRSSILIGLAIRFWRTM